MGDRWLRPGAPLMIDSTKIMAEVVEIGVERDEALKLLADALPFLPSDHPVAVKIKTFIRDCEEWQRR